MRFIFEKTDDVLITHSGLTAIGALLHHTNLKKRVNGTTVSDCKKPVISHADVLLSYIGLLVQGKNDFDAIEPFRDDTFFSTSLGITGIPSSPTMRQRLDQAAENTTWNEMILEESAKLIRKLDIPVTPVSVGSGAHARRLVPLDIDVSPFDNSNSKKEGISRTYKGTYGYSPIFAYVGQEGFVAHAQLRTGSTHVQSGTETFLAESIGYAKQMTDQPLLLRMDAGNDCKANLHVCHNETTFADYIIKRNLRRECKQSWLHIATQCGTELPSREGKRIFVGTHLVNDPGFEKPLRIVYQVTERTMLNSGQLLLFPEIEVSTYWTSLTCAPEEVIALYRDHGTSEQFHSELKTDLDLERLPAGKFSTNHLVLIAGIFAYNLLRIIGQESLNTKKSPMRNNVRRRRIRSVIQNMIYLAAQFVRHGRKIKVQFGLHCPWFETMHNVYQRFTRPSLLPRS